MCGVVAAVCHGSSGAVEDGMSVMMHRGIRERIDCGASWAMGHVRLPIVGTGADHDQPVRRGRWTIGFVGEVLDFRERNPTAECDVDTVADAWTELGPSGFTEFDGFWSVVAVDRESDEIHCLVDYLSQKPLYVRSDPYARGVASEPDAVAAMGPTRPDWIYLSAVVKWGYCPETWRTPYEGIRRMGPGEYLVMSDRGIVRGPIVTDPIVPVGINDRSVLAADITDAVRRRVTSSDVPVAMLLSGGVDSSIVFHLVGRYGDVHCYHVENGETDRCRRINPGVDLVQSDDVPIDRCLGWMQEPLDLGSLVPQCSLSSSVASSGGERVCLTGDGADEMFGGYRRSTRYDSWASDVYHELVAWHLPRLDRIMMRNRIEVRTPYLARRVVQIAAGLPRTERTGKSILRECFRDLGIPSDVVDAPKRALRTARVHSDREAASRELVDMFIRLKGWNIA